LSTAPFHWDGQQPDMRHVMSLTMGDRMGERVTTVQVRAVSTWLDALPAPPGAAVDDAAERGRHVFRYEAACARCHSGEALTDDDNADVGTGGAFQVPSLRGVRVRPPYFHDGCAPTLESVVAGACNTAGRHGRTAALTDRQRADLLAYLRTL